MKFFREPRLGCYLSLDLTYKTSLNYESLLSAIECTKNYEEAKAAQEQRKKEWSDQQEDIKKQIAQIKEDIAREEEAKRIAEEKALEKAQQAQLNQENGEGGNQSPKNNNLPEEKKEIPQTEKTQIAKPKDQTQQQIVPEQENPIEALEKQLTDWKEEPVKLAAYTREETKLYLCLDTLGQDRLFTDDEKKFIKLIGYNIKNSMERLEQHWLEKDRDLRIKFIESEVKIKSQDKYSNEKAEDLVSFTVNQFYQSEEYKSKGITEEDEKQIEGDIVRMKYYKEAYLTGDFRDIIETFKDFEFVEFSKAFQNIFYFCREEPLEINEKKTNKLEWKKARNYWSNIFNYIKNYNPIGAKPEQIKSIYKLNKIKENLELVLTKKEEIRAYSQTLLMFIEFIIFLTKLRHDDIIRRLCSVAIAKDRREQIIKSNAEIDEERNKIIEEAKSLNPNVKLPGEKGAPIIPSKLSEKKEEEKAKIVEEANQETKEKQEGEGEEAKQEEKGETQTQNVEEKEDETEEKKNEQDSIRLAQQLMKFDEDHQKKEVPQDIEYDIDNDYDIEQSEKDNFINAALQSANNKSFLDRTKLK